MNIQGLFFNFFKPNFDLEVPANSVFLTAGALEQTGDQYNAFLEFVIMKKPALCVNVEPIVEFLDQDNLVDYTAYRCGVARNFLSGYIDAIKALEQQGHAEILNLVRSHFGSLMLESYCQVIWRPSKPSQLTSNFVPNYLERPAISRVEQINYIFAKLFDSAIVQKDLMDHPSK